MKLVIFLVSGHTFTFAGVEIVDNNETGLSFTYESVSDGLWKQATFYKQHVAGFSIREDS